MASINLIEKNSAGSTLNTYNVYCKDIKVGWTNSLDAKPYANSMSQGVSSVQKNGFENPIYTINGATLTATSTALTYDDLVRLAKLTTATTSNYIVLSVDYGISGSVPLVDSAEATSGVKVVIKNFNMSLGLNRQSGDDQRSMTGTIVLQESS